MSVLGTNNPFRKRACMPPGVPASQPQPPVDPSAPSLFDSDPPSFTSESASATIRTNSAGAGREPLPDSNTRPDSPAIDGNVLNPRSPEYSDPAKKKHSKKVQIQTPPPISPSSPEYDSSSSEDAERSRDPFSQEDVVRDGQIPVASPPQTRSFQDAAGANNGHQASPARRRPNPFAKTLRDMEHGGNGGDGRDGLRSPPRASMDVDAFKRLLLTGYSGLDGHEDGHDWNRHAPVVSPQVSSDSVETFKPNKSQNASRLQPPDSASTTDASRQSSLFDAIPESPNAITPHEPEEEGPLAASTMPARKKQPPPAPTSRHGKLIKVELGKDQPSEGKSGGEPGGAGSTNNTVPRLHRSPSDINKPLPPQPMHITFDDSPFDREAAGKLPEPVEKDAHVAMLHTPPLALFTAATATETTPNHQPQSPAAKRNPAPLPPPRRHTRGESKILTGYIPNTTHSTPSPSAMAEDVQQPVFPAARRSSVESTRSWTKTQHAPAPPPPRRPNHQPARPSVSSIPLGSPGYLNSPSSVSLPSPAHASIPYDTASVYSVSSDCPPPIPPPHSAKHSNTLSPIHANTFPIVHSQPPVALASGGGGGGSSNQGTAVRGPATKLYPPPRPPPARNPSTRRPLSISSFDLGAVPRKSSREGAPPPLPPKRGTRGIGEVRAGGGGEAGKRRRGSIDVRDQVVILEETTSSSVVMIDGDAKVDDDNNNNNDGDGDDDGVMVVVEGGKSSHANEILADLSALQMEVDALRGRYKEVGYSVDRT